MSFIITKDERSIWCGVALGLFVMVAANLWFMPMSAQAQSNWQAPARADTIKNPYKVDESFLALGKKMFKAQCSSCHGTDAKGDGPAATAMRPRPANLQSTQIQKESEGAIYWKINTGRNNMPSFQNSLSQKQRWAIVSFIKSLGASKESSNAQKKLPQGKFIHYNSHSNQASLSSGISYRVGDTHVALMGEAGVGVNITKNQTSFTEPDLGLMPLVQEGRFFLESGFDVGIGSPVEVGPLNLSYMLPHGILLRLGQFDALPIGRYPRSFDPGWINPLASGPLGFDNFGDLADFGLQVQGSGFIGNMRVRTFLSLTNGFTLQTDPGSAGLLSSGPLEDNNKAKMIGGRISVTPFFSSNFDIGVSDYFNSNVGDSGTPYDGINSNVLAVDANIAPIVRSLKGFLRLRGQVNFVHVGKATYMDASGQPYTFDNNSSVWYGMVAYQPSMLSSPFLRSMMASFMLSHLNVPAKARWNDISTGTQYDVGLTYWFTWRTNLKFSYNIQENTMNTLMLRVSTQI